MKTRKRMEEQHRKDQAILPTSVISMDVEELRVTHYDWMKMTGELPMTTRSESLKLHLAKDKISGFNEDKWKQLSDKEMDVMSRMPGRFYVLDLDSTYSFLYKYS